VEVNAVGVARPRGISMMVNSLSFLTTPRMGSPLMTHVFFLPDVNRHGGRREEAADKARGCLEETPGKKK